MKESKGIKKQVTGKIKETFEIEKKDGKKVVVSHKVFSDKPTEGSEEEEEDGNSGTDS